jgi:hypothetical protein
MYNALQSGPFTAHKDDSFARFRLADLRSDSHSYALQILVGNAEPRKTKTVAATVQAQRYGIGGIRISWRRDRAPWACLWPRSTCTSLTDHDRWRQRLEIVGVSLHRY